MTRYLLGLLVTLALAMLVAPLAADAQLPGHVPCVGFLDPGHPEVGRAFRQGLQELGYVEEHNVILE
jgi:hypothetical protein